MKSVILPILLFTMVPVESLAQSRHAALPRQIYGKVQIIDGNSFEIIKSHQVIRLAGYVAPRPEQTAISDGVSWPVGEVSRAWMVLQTLGQNVNCSPLSRGANNILIAHCFVGDTNLAAAAIAQGIGYAFNYHDEPHVPAYSDIERKARGLGLGVWSSPDLLPPWLYVATANDEASAVNRGTHAPITAYPVPLDSSLSHSDKPGG